MTKSALSCARVWKLYGTGAENFLAGRSELATIDEVRAAGLIPAVRDVSLSVAPGELLVVMGLSGSGKSTLLRCLCRLVEPTAGAVRVDGAEILGLDEPALLALRRDRMGMVFQSFGLLPHRTVIGNVAFPLEMRGQPRSERMNRSREVIRLVGLEGREDNFPHELSGGQQQRVGIARSLVIDPDLWFLDEPFSALDPLIRREMQDEFIRLRGEGARSIVFVTHDFDEALRLADRIAIMKDGAVEQCDTPDRIVLNPATEYVAAFIDGVDRAQVVHAGTLGRPVDGPIPEIAPVLADATIKSLARRLIDDTSDTYPIAGPDGAVTGLLPRAAALDVLVGQAFGPPNLAISAKNVG